MAAETRPKEGSVMARTARPWLTLVLLGAILAPAAARAQVPLSSPTATAPATSNATATRPDTAKLADQVVDDIQSQTLPAPLPAQGGVVPDTSWEPEFLKTLPHPPDEPRSLFAPASEQAPPPPDLERYFERDPLLDPPQWGNTGWFTDFQLGVIKPVLDFGQVRTLLPLRTVGVPPAAPAFPLKTHAVAAAAAARTPSPVVAPGAGKLPWTVAPRIEIGYRLPSGFGGFSFSDRFFSASSTAPFAGPVGDTTRSTRLGVNYCDWDYFSNEFTPWNSPTVNWTLVWRAGVRLQETWTTVLADKPFAEAATTNGVFIQGSSNYTVGAGPHFAVNVERTHLPSGLQFIARLDIADTFSRTRQMFAASTTAIGANGIPERGVFGQNFWNQIPILNYQVGLGWKPPSNPNISFYMGYVYEFWWQFASNMNELNPFVNQGATRGTMSNQGMVFQWQWRW
jgi:hypothetical protein